MEPAFSGSNQPPTQEEIESLLRIVLKPLFGAKIDKVLPMYSSNKIQVFDKDTFIEIK